MAMSTPSRRWSPTTDSRREAQAGAVEVAAEGDAVVVDRAQRGEAEDLEAAAVGEQRPRPADEPVQAAEAGDRLDAGPHRQVVEVAQQDLRARLLEPL